MKKIELHITDEAYKVIRDGLIIRKMSGQAYGPVDSFTNRVLKSIEEEKDFIVIELKGGK
jgi:hypothetical protein